MKLNEAQEALVIAHEKGYRVVNGQLLSPGGKPLAVTLKDGKYQRFTLKISKRDRRIIYVHRLVAYQKYGNKLFEKGIEVRHKDGNSFNNNNDNILLGTRSENQMDIPESERKQIRLVGRKAAQKALRKFSRTELEEIRAYHSKVRSYKKTMEKFGITSKGSLHYMLNADYTDL